MGVESAMGQSRILHQIGDADAVGALLASRTEALFTIRAWVSSLCSGSNASAVP